VIWVTEGIRAHYQPLPRLKHELESGLGDFSLLVGLELIKFKVLEKVLHGVLVAPEYIREIKLRKESSYEVV